MREVLVVVSVAYVVYLTAPQRISCFQAEIMSGIQCSFCELYLISLYNIIAAVHVYYAEHFWGEDNRTAIMILHTFQIQLVNHSGRVINLRIDWRVYKTTK